MVPQGARTGLAGGANAVDGALLVCLSIPFVLGNASRPLAWPGETSILKRTRTEMYFAERPNLAAPFHAAASAARTCPGVSISGTTSMCRSAA